MPKVPARIHCRPAMERMLFIHERLQATTFPNSKTLAKELEVQPRTIKRDMDFMRCRLKLPIAYNDLEVGFYYSRKVDHFPNHQITEAELFALLVAHKAIAAYHGTPFHQPLETAFAKLTGQLDRQSRYTVSNVEGAFSFRPFAPEDTDLRTFEVLTRGLRGRRTVRFFYRNLGAVKAQRRSVHPYHLACVENHWYLFAHDVDRQAMRTFVLTRVREPELTDERFTLPKRFDPQEYLRGSFGVFKGADDYEVVIEFDRWAADLLRGRRWHASQELMELPQGRIRLRLRLDNLEEVERWVLSWGTHATVIRPMQLAERIERVTGEIQARYAALRHSAKTEGRKPVTTGSG